MTPPKLTMYETAVYRIRVQGAFDESWLQQLDADWAVQLSDDGEGLTTTIGRFPGDQAALIGLLCNLYDVGLPLLEVTCFETKAGQPCFDA